MQNTESAPVVVQQAYSNHTAIWGLILASLAWVAVWFGEIGVGIAFATSLLGTVCGVLGLILAMFHKFKGIQFAGAAIVVGGLAFALSLYYLLD